MSYKPERVKPFVILFQGRAGSTYLIEALKSHPLIRATGEDLVGLKNEGPERQIEWARQFLKPPPGGEYGAVGFKTKLTDVLDREAFRHVLREAGAHIIHLERRNSVKRVVSWLNAERLYASTGEWNLYRESDRIPAIRIEVEDFRERLQEIEEGSRQLGRYVTSLNLPTIHIIYELLLLEPRAVIRQTLTFLGVPVQKVNIKCKKHTSDNLRDAVSNFDELRASFVGTQYEAMFDEVLAPTSPTAR